MDNRAGGKIVAGRFYRKPLKEFAPAQEEFFYGGKKERLAEAPGTGEKDALIRLEHPEDMGGLVGVDISAFYDFIECLDTDGQWFGGWHFFISTNIFRCLPNSNRQVPK
jgi:hypothetical protein